MVEYNTIDVPKGIDVNKTNKCTVCHYLLKINFKFGPVSIK